MEKQRRDFVKQFAKYGAVLPSLAILNSCAAFAPKIRTIYVPERDAIMLRQDVHNVKVWAKAKDQMPMAGKMDLEEGWM